MKGYHVAALLLLLLLVACGSTADGPPEIRYGEDACDQCQMIISEPRFAAAYASDSGDVYLFDDIGEMFLHAHEEERKVRTFWVHDYHDESWLETEGAAFVYDPELPTPMGWGVTAFGDRKEAVAYQAERGGTLLTATELQAQIASGELRPAGMSARLEGAREAEHNHDE